MHRTAHALLAIALAAPVSAGLITTDEFVNTIDIQLPLSEQVTTVNADGFTFTSDGSGTGRDDLLDRLSVNDDFERFFDDDNTTLNDFAGITSIRIDVALEGVTQFGFRHGTSLATELELSAFDADDNPLGSARSTNPRNGSAFLGLETSTAAAYYVISEPNGENGRISAFTGFVAGGPAVPAAPTAGAITVAFALTSRRPRLRPIARR